MKLIAHRGNISGPEPGKENMPWYLDEAIECGFDVETDLWWVDNQWWLGHDRPQYETTPEWLIEREDTLWCHCKNLAALDRFVEGMGGYMNYFWHQHDAYALTSLGYVWTEPGNVCGAHSILVDLEGKANHDGIMGVCTDYPLNLA